MADIILGCDSHSASYDEETKKTIAKILENAGHTVEILNTGPNYTQTAMQKTSNKGKIAIYLVNGADIATYKDFAVGIQQGYYHVTHAYFGLQGYINGDTCSCEGAKTVKLGKAWDDNYSSDSFRADVVGKTTAEICEMYPEIDYACGSSREELGNHLVSVISGESPNQSKNTDSGDDEEEGDDKDNFTPHKGQIMQIKPYKEFSSISFDKSYDSPTGTGSVEVLFKSKDYRFIYKGVAMKLKLRRTCDAQWQHTWIDNKKYLKYDENEIFFKEHIPTNELLKELGLPNYRIQRGLMQTFTNDDETDENDGSKWHLDDRELQELSPSQASDLAKQTKRYDAETIGKLKKIAKET